MALDTASTCSRAAFGTSARTVEPVAPAGDRGRAYRCAMERAAQGVSSHSGCGSCRLASEPLMSTSDDNEGLRDAIHRSFTSAETDARLGHRKKCGDAPHRA